MLNYEKFFELLKVPYDEYHHLLMDDKTHVWLNKDQITIMQVERSNNHVGWLHQLARMPHAIAMLSRSGFLTARLMYSGDTDETEQAVNDCLHIVKLC